VLLAGLGPPVAIDMKMPSEPVAGCFDRRSRS
jgi:hypothetical protein